MPANGSAWTPPDDRLRRASSIPRCSREIGTALRTGSSAFTDDDNSG